MTLGHILLAVFWIVFCFFHSFFANLGVKQKAANWLKQKFIYYRFYYTVFAFVSFGLVIFYQLWLPSFNLFQKTTVTNITGMIIGGGGLVIMAICIRKYFMSLSGVKTLIADHTQNDLQITGIHRFMRHPLYSGTFLFIWGLFLLIPTLSLFIANAIITGYTLLAIRWEEEKLIAEFGDQYRQYKKRVPRLIPFLKTS